jgi:hypothetical protein
MISIEVARLMRFFKTDQAEIERQYGSNLRRANWSWKDDGYVQEKSGLQHLSFNTDDEFLFHMSALANRTNVDFYPTLLKVIEILNLPELDAKLETIFLGTPNYNCATQTLNVHT